MVRKLTIATVTLLLLATPVVAEEKQTLAAEGKKVIGAFASILKGELVAAMKTGGPPHAITVCNVKAPMIATQVSQEKGWIVARSSHKLRNADNAGDDYTNAAIEDFLLREKNGEKPADMVKTDIIEEDGKRVFRMVKAIPTGKVCLSCHGGDEVKAKTEEALTALYPSDQARGFKIGDMRGVFTLQKALTN